MSVKSLAIIIPALAMQAAPADPIKAPQNLSEISSRRGKSGDLKDGDDTHVRIREFGERKRQLADTQSGSDRMSKVIGLPHSRGKAFATLDEYLAHLKSLGPIDIPYYEEVAPGRYRKITRGADPRIYTRAELAAKYGFGR